jgi:hypothetical protein
MVPKPDLLIWVTAPTSQSAAVVLNRGHSRVPATTGAARLFAEHAQTTFEVLAGIPALKEAIYRVDNSASAPENHSAAIRERASRIGDFLIQRLHRHQAQAVGQDSDPVTLELPNWAPVSRRFATSNGRMP